MLFYETPVLNDREPPKGHPPTIQELVDAQLIQVQSNGISLRNSELQQRSWADYCEGLGQPSRYDWSLWRKQFSDHPEGLDYFMVPGENMEEFSQVWIHEISLQAIQPSNL
ncbi:hypothetical protein [Acaryochloris sp. CCMEE 5410]|uniref:hypothetical protein n=1 Tax=Acaryochloris sp. CCMEE 5410 TaxID=310037 RepID=UPI00031D375D|nr:hypothetical protein [Acaryochloris sp. CCMEE 5410]